MNNQAFRKLVHQHTSGSINKSGSGKKSRASQSESKSNKEFARYAVEQEFNEIKKKRKKNGSGFDGDFNASDDDDDDNYDSNAKKDNEKESVDENNEKGNNDRRKRKRGNQSEENDSSKSKYRDRAKERREGKNVDYQATEGMYLPQGDIGDKKVKEMSKYLGGDESYTHLVKGLDKTLADRIRREAIKGKESSDMDIDNLDLDEVMKEAKALKAKEKAKKEQSNPVAVTIREKKRSKIPLVSNMARYVEKFNEQKNTNVPISSIVKSKNTSTAVQSMHRSMLTFSMKQNHHDLLQYGWELPKVSIMSNQQFSSINGRTLNDGIVPSTSCTPLDRNLILKIKSVLNAANETKKKMKYIKQELNTTDSNLKGEKISDHSTTAKKLSKDDSDDDIYGDIGNYI